MKEVIIKKNIGVILLATISCIVFTEAMFSSFSNSHSLSRNGNIYLLQYGSYINKSIMEENVQRLNNYISYENDGKYYVFLGVYTNLELAKRVSEIFENKNIYTYIKNDYLGDREAINRIMELEKEIIEENDLGKIDIVNNKILDTIKDVVY